MATGTEFQVQLVGLMNTRAKWREVPASTER
jgi:hypothetical protein